MRVLGLFVASLNAQSICQTNCEDENLRCLSRCTIGDSACIRVCVDDEDKCMAKCSSKSFALLQGTKTPKILNFDLDISEDLVSKFDYNGHEVDMSCSIEYQGGMYIMGGFYNEHRVSKVQDCGLRFHGLLPRFTNGEFFEHKCAVFQDEIWMCALAHDKSGCYSYDLTTLTPRANTTYEHLLGGLEVFNNELTIIGGYTIQVEILASSELSEWAPFEDTLGDVLNSFTTIVFDETLYVFGGFSQLARDYVKRIWAFDQKTDDRTWKIIGQTIVPRSNYRSVLVNDVFYTAGGFGDLENEEWSFSNKVSTKANTKVLNSIMNELISVAYLGENCL